jgi:histidinol-phosphate phosphatase family protein
MRPAIFLDRDGVVIANHPDYVRSWADVSFIPRALETLATMAGSPYAIVIVTNQAGVGRGLIPLAEAVSINERVRDEIVRAGGRVDGLYLCPHTDADNCDCRKPRPGMLLRAARELRLDLSRSWMVGDALPTRKRGVRRCSSHRARGRTEIHAQPGWLCRSFRSNSLHPAANHRCVRAHRVLSAGCACT